MQSFFTEAGGCVAWRKAGSCEAKIAASLTGERLADHTIAAMLPDEERSWRFRRPLRG